MQGVIKLTINNPKKKNALNGYMMMKLNDFIEKYENSNDYYGLIITGKDNNFCTGLGNKMLFYCL